MTDPPMYNIASDVTSRSLAIVLSLLLPGCDICGFELFIVNKSLFAAAKVDFEYFGHIFV